MERRLTELLIFFSSIFLACVVAFSAHAAKFVSYKDWKSQKVSIARVKYEGLIKKKQRRDPLSDEVSTKLRRARVQVALTEELGPNDYFQLYLNPTFGNNFKALELAAKGLKPSEVAEIFVAYSQYMKRIQVGAPAPHQWANQIGPSEPAEGETQAPIGWKR